MMTSSGEEDAEVIKSLAKKRSRQRVDAGEPRNSYASIPNFSSRPGIGGNIHFGSNGFVASSKMLNDLTGRALVCDPDVSMMIMDGDELMRTHQDQLEKGQFLRGILQGNNGLSRNNGELESSTGHPSRTPSPCMSSGPSSPAHAPNQQLSSGVLVIDEEEILSPGNSCSIPPPPTPTNASRSTTGTCKSHSVVTKLEQQKRSNLVNMGDVSTGNDRDESSPTDDQPTPSSSPTLLDVRSPDDSVTVRSTDSPIQLKRARVENIVTNMVMTNSPQQQVNGCKKRKQYQPQQHDVGGGGGGNERFSDTDDEDEYEQEWSRSKHRKTDKESLKGQLKWMQEQLSVMQEKYNTLLTNGANDAGSDTDGRGTISSNNGGNVSDTSKVTPDVTEDEEEKEEEEFRQQNVSVLKSPIKENPLPNGNVHQRGQYHQRQPHHHHHHHHNHSDNLMDPSLFIDEARRLVFEQQEKLAKESELGVASPNRPKIERNNIPFGLPQAANAAALLTNVVEFLKTELSTSLPRIVDNIVANYVTHNTRSLFQTPPKLMDANNLVNRDLVAALDRKSPRTKVSDRGRAVSSAGTTPSNNVMTSSLSLSSSSQRGETVGSMLNHHRVSPFTERSTPIKPFPAIFPSVAKMPTAPLSIMYGGGLPTSSHPSPNLPPLTSASSTTNGGIVHNNTSSSFNRPESSSPEQTEAISLVMPAKKKRTKVTDTRPSSRTIRNLGLDNDSPSTGKFPFPFSGDPSPVFHPSPLTSIVPNSLPTSVAIPNPTLHQSDIFGAAGFHFDHNGHPKIGLSPYHPAANREDREEAEIRGQHMTSLQHHLLLAPHSSPADVHPLHPFQSHNAKGEMKDDFSECHNGSRNASDIMSPYDNVQQRFDLNFGYSSTLTPMHLRKAKLMFFYVRYPSSAVLKTFFPDIKFNKNNTAQLVKWFSNFREFYYIQMEKYARQALSEGVKNADELNVSVDCELYRILNLHYNRNNHIEVPTNFRYVIEQSLREFFRSIMAGKDGEQSWKKAIYKVIARLDDNVPDYFKSPNFLEQLE